MNRPALSALALAMVAGAAKAGDHEVTNDWTSLDRELSGLASTLSNAPDANGAKVNFWLKTNYLNQDVHNANDTSGFQLQGVRITFSGDVAPGYSVKVQVETASGTALIRDAYGTVKLCKEATLTMGNFKVPFLFSETDADEKGLFYERTGQGSLWTTRDIGAMVKAEIENFRIYGAATNGSDGPTERMFLDGKVAWDSDPANRIDKQEGGYGVNVPTHFTLATSYIDDDSTTDAQAWALEGEAVSGPLWVQAEYIDYQKGWANLPSFATGPGAKSAKLGDTKPFDVQAGWMLNENWELAVRSEFPDTGAAHRESVYGGGINYYVKGHDCKWQLDVIKVDSANASVDTTKIELGLTLVI